MRHQLRLAIFLASATIVNAQTDRRLVGCPDPIVISRALAELRRIDWQRVTVPIIQNIWPTELLGIDCDTIACSSVGSKGRIINGQYQCSEVFFLDINEGVDHADGGQLKNLVIHYSGTRRQVELGAKMMARAVGLKEPDVETLGNGLHHNFLWEDGTRPALSGLNVELSHSGAVWTVMLNFSRVPRPSRFSKGGNRQSCELPSRASRLPDAQPLCTNLGAVTQILSRPLT